MSNGVEEEVIEIISRQLEKNPGEIKLGDRIVEDLGADSLDFFEIMLNLEDRYRAHCLKIPFSDKVNCVGDAIKYIQEYLNLIFLIFLLIFSRIVFR